MMTGETSWQDAIEDVNAAQNTIDQVFGRANAHQITRLVFRKIWIHNVEHGMHFVFGLANRQAADGDAGRIERRNKFSGLRPQVGLNAALDDAE